MKSDTFLTALKEYWFLVVFIGSVVFAWSTLDARVKVVESTITIHEVKIQQALDGVGSIKETLARIDATLNFIKEQVTKK